jgi:hypothetical protein
MAGFEFRYVGGRDSHRAAVRRALQVADAKGINPAGEPVVRRRRFPIPILGPRTQFLVRFDDATHDSADTWIARAHRG